MVKVKVGVGTEWAEMSITFGLCVKCCSACVVINLLCVHIYHHMQKIANLTRPIANPSL